MADLSSFYQTYTNTGGNGVTLTTNFGKHVINQADVGREIIVSATKGGGLAEADLTAVRNQLTLAGGDGTGTDQGGPDAFTVAAIGTATGAAFSAGVTTVVFLRVQGTGTPNLTTVSGVTLDKVAEFTPAL
jgi:hypothetical protein